MSTPKEYTVKGYPSIIPHLIVIEMFDDKGVKLAESLISMDQWDSSKFMAQLLDDVLCMRKHGIKSAFIQPESEVSHD